MFCEKCGYKLKNGVRICPNCGHEKKYKGNPNKLKIIILIFFVFMFITLILSYSLIYLGFLKLPKNIESKLQDYNILPQYISNDLVINSLIAREEGAKNSEAYIEDPRDGNKYRIVKMPDGNWWMAENLRFSKNLYIDNYYHYVNGIKTGSLLNFTNIGENAWCDTLNLPIDSNFEKVCNKYGLLYTGLGMKNKELCPPGWKVPSKDQWVKMFIEVAKKENIEVNKNDKFFPITNYLKSEIAGWGLTGFTYKVEDKYGFSVIPVTGNKVLYRYDGKSLSKNMLVAVDLSYMDLDYSQRFLWPSEFWTSDLQTENIENYLPNQVYFTSIQFQELTIELKSENSNSGLSIRCIKK